MFDDVLQMEEGLCPAPVTTAEEVLVSSRDATDREAIPHKPEETRGAVAMTLTEREESGEVEPWAATVPPVRSFFLWRESLSYFFINNKAILICVCSSGMGAHHKT